MPMRYSNGQHYSVAMSDFKLAYIKGLRDNTNNGILDTSINITSVQAYDTGECDIYAHEDPNITWFIHLPANKQTDYPRMMYIRFLYYDFEGDNDKEETLELDYDKFMDEYLGKEDVSN